MLPYVFFDSFEQNAGLVLIFFEYMQVCCTHAFLAYHASF